MLKRENNKIEKLVEILEESIRDNKNLKTIIFVRDRSVAVYLQRLLAGDKEVGKSDKICEGLLDKNKFKIGFAMGF